MPDLEKAITGLELCTHISQDGCMMLCPYRDEVDETYPGFCEHIMKRDVLELLKPRILTLLEIYTSEVVWLEWCRTSGQVEAVLLNEKWDREYTFLDKHEGHLLCDSTWYEINWRCWSAKPTVEQMKAKKWKH